MMIPRHLGNWVAPLSLPFVGAATGGQIFLLDFDTFEGTTADDHTYIPAERAQITGEMNSLFVPLGMSVTDTPPAMGPYSTVFFNTSAAGTSDGIDPGNIEKDDNARVKAKKMLAVVGIDPGDMTSGKIVRASIKVGMHEALHLVGARHQDAFAEPGSGVPTAGTAARGLLWAGGHGAPRCRHVDACSRAPDVRGR